MISLSEQWVVVIIEADTFTSVPCGCTTPTIDSLLGPFEKVEAVRHADQFNAEHDGSPYHAIVRPLLKLDIATSKGGVHAAGH